MSRTGSFIFIATVAFAPMTWAAAPAGAADADIVVEMGLKESAAPVRTMTGWEKPRKIVVLTDDTARVASFKDVAPGVAVIGARGPREAAAHMKDADALVGFCVPEFVGAAPRLKWIQSQLAGADGCIDIPRVRSGDILFTNMQRVNGPNVAEHAMALVLALTRQINVAVVNQQDEKWNRRGFALPRDLEGSTMLVVGLGGIGTEIARRARAFNMRVIATRNSSREGPDFVSYVGLANELPDLIGQADIVVNATPLTPATTGMFDAALFERMKRSAYFINIGRGGSVVTDDLVEALNARQIGGAGLDVTDPEPLPAGHPLWSAPNVIITPHVAGASRVKMNRVWAVMRENIRRYVAGEKMLSVVDVERGY